MGIYVLAAVAITVSVVVVGFALRPRGESGVIRRALRFIGGPFPLSIAIHVALLLFLIVTVHESRGRDLVLVNLEAGGGGGSGSELNDFDVPDVPMPEVAPRFDSPMPSAVDAASAVALSDSYARSLNGIGVGRGPGIGSGTGPGMGTGFAGFIGYLRRTGMDAVLVIDGTDSMRTVIDDVKARMTEIVRAIHHVVPTARVGIVVYGGPNEPLDLQPLTMSSSRIETFLAAVHTKGGGEWEENLYGAVHAAVDRMEWRPLARKVIVVVGDAPPKAEQLVSLLEIAREFRARNGLINAIDVTAQEHERFEREMAIRVHRTEPGTVSPLPAFYQQTRAAYVALERAGGGGMKSLDGDDKVNQQVLVLAFGDGWRAEVERFARVSDTASSR